MIYGVTITADVASGFKILNYCGCCLCFVLKMWKFLYVILCGISCALSLGFSQLVLYYSWSVLRWKAFWWSTISLTFPSVLLCMVNPRYKPIFVFFGCLDLDWIGLDCMDWIRIKWCKIPFLVLHLDLSFYFGEKRKRYNILWVFGDGSNQ